MPLDISNETTEISIIVALSIFLSCALALTYSKRVKIQQPPVGRTNWKDATLILVAIPFFTLLVIYVPSVIIVALLFLSLFVAFASFLSPIIRKGILAALIAIVVIAAQMEVRNFWLNDFIVVTALVFISSFFMQTGMKTKEVVYLAVGYSLYDLASVFILPSLIKAFTISSPLVPMVVVLISSQGRVVGGGDILLTALFAIALEREFGLRVGALFAGIAALFTFAISETVAASSSIPVSPFFTAAFLIIVWRARSGQTHSSAPSTFPSDQPLRTSSQTPVFEWGSRKCLDR